jgi:hypothetical protein
MELVGFKESFALLIHSYLRKVKKDKTYIRDLGALKQLNTIDQLKTAIVSLWLPMLDERESLFFDHL